MGLMDDPSHWTRACPDCGTALTYSSYYSWSEAKRRRQRCQRCHIAARHPTHDEIITLVREGLSDREVANRLGSTHHTVAKHRRKAGIAPSDVRGRAPIQLVSESEAVCSRCGGVKPITEYQFIRKGQEYESRLSYCNECRKTQYYKRISSDVRSYLHHRLGVIRRRANSENIPFALSLDDVLAIFDAQHGLCFYTDQPMTWGVGEGPKRDRISFDKVVPEVGYVVGNVVLCQFRINGIKSDMTLTEMEEWMPGWHARLVNGGFV